MSSKYSAAHFLSSAPTIAALPPDFGVEVAFAGRSNAGKSSAINAITNNKGLARTSKTPGRTQQLIFFQVSERIRLVDLPGYGYAQVPIAVKQQWHNTLEQYFKKRTSLRGLVLVMDIRHPLKEFDRQMLSWCQTAKMPTHVLLTKSDKLTPNQARQALAAVTKELAQDFPDASIQIFSAIKKTGVDGVHRVLDQWTSK